MNSNPTQTDRSSREQVLNDAHRILAERFTQPPFDGFHALRMSFADRLWIIVTRPSHETEEFQLGGEESAEEFVERVARVLAG
jgi:hypothetical protein